MLDDRKKRLFGIGYLMAAMMIAVPCLELVANAWPLTPTAARWRFGAIGYLGNVLVVPMLGVCLAVATAAALGQRRMLRTLSVLSLLGAVCMVGFAGSLFLDALELRVGVNQALIRSYDIASAKALTSLGFASLIFLGLGITGWRASAASRSAATSKDARRVATPAPRVVVGSTD